MTAGNTRISIENLVARVPPGLAVPSRVKFSPDGRWIAWLQAPDRSANRKLFVHAVDSGETRQIESPAPEVDESNLSDEEKLRRQRLREFGHGVATFNWTDQGRLIVPTTHQIWSLEPTSREWSQLLEVNEAAIIDPQLSPEGNKIAWVQGGELRCADLQSGETYWVTKKVAEGVTHGAAGFLAQEEMDRMRGFWWSPDGARIAYEEVDERDVPLYNIAHTTDDPYEHESHHYPFAGGPNPTSRLFVVDLSTREHAELDLEGADYLARVHWTGETALVVELENRSQTRLELWRYDVVNRSRSLLHAETSDTWLNLHLLFRGLKDGGFVWASERDGFQHLEVRNSDGRMRNQLTSGEWMVRSVDALDEERDRIWFSAAIRGATQVHFCSVALSGGNVDVLTQEAGTHRVSVDPRRRYFADLHDDVTAPPVLTLRDLADGSAIRELFSDEDPRVAALGLQAPQLREVETRDGTKLRVAVHLPHGNGPFPTLLHVYGGPGVQRVRNAYSMTADLEHQYLRERGVCVVLADNRGSSGRGVAFEKPIYRNLGDVEVRDQADVLEALAAEGIVNRSRIAVEGASYGGYMAVMCLAQRPDLFKAAVGQALVSHWDAYDSTYTERYMGTPAENPDAYERSSLMYHVAGIRGKLLLIHGMLDENVHFRHMARLINALIKHAVPYQLMLYPDERHSPVSEAERAHMKQQTIEFILDALEVAR